LLELLFYFLVRLAARGIFASTAAGRTGPSVLYKEEVEFNLKVG
jgi:hypothetical protein